MSEIKVGEYGLENSTEGMYARTTNGIIGIIVNANSDELINGPEIRVNERIYCIERDSIKNTKENIIDLIEEGDYVDGMQVDSIDKKERKIYIDFGDREIIITEDEIDTIVTKEQFKNMEYKVGE